MPATPRVLLLQARVPEDPMRAHELDCFMAQTKLPREAFNILNVAHDRITDDALREIDVVMVGGSGDFSFAMGGFSWSADFQSLLKTIMERELPTFGSCFGFQGIIMSLGGSMIRMDGTGEIGTFAITLTEEGKQDPIFSGFPETFMAQLGHNDMAPDLPNECIHLASSALAPYQAIRVRGLPVFATQFHPELDHNTNFERFVRYIENYKLPEETIDEAIERTSKDYVESPEASALLRRFMKLELDYDPT